MTIGILVKMARDNSAKNKNISHRALFTRVVLLLLFISSLFVALLVSEKGSVVVVLFVCVGLLANYVVTGMRSYLCYKGQTADDRQQEPDTDPYADLEDEDEEGGEEDDDNVVKTPVEKQQ
ncbi:MAG: hypothetical protein II944_00600 [Ruminobacter sp.]|jgi:hypothetical protein|nr:hypothetical protein [Ruminobacter sp.]